MWVLHFKALINKYTIFSLLFFIWKKIQVLGRTDHLDCIENSTFDSSFVVVCMSVATGMCLPSCCLAAIGAIHIWKERYTGKVG
jgi:hypothetical protein